MTVVCIHVSDLKASIGARLSGSQAVCLSVFVSVEFGVGTFN